MMTSRDFVYWLQGYLEIADKPVALSKEQVAIVQKHLAMVFAHEIDPSMGGTKEQNILDALHNSVPDKDIIYRC